MGLIAYDSKPLGFVYNSRYFFQCLVPLARTLSNRFRQTSQCIYRHDDNVVLVYIFCRKSIETLIIHFTIQNETTYGCTKKLAGIHQVIQHESFGCYNQRCGLPWLIRRHNGR